MRLLLISLNILQIAFTKESSEEDSTNSDEEDSLDTAHFLYKRMKQDAGISKKLPADVYTIPGPQEPLPGRSHPGDYWPVFPFQNQYSGGLDLDPSISRHIGGDLNLAVPSWGMLDIYGRFFNRIHDTTTKVGYVNSPVNMLDLEKEDLVQLMSNPSTHFNRAAQPRLPIAKLGKSYVPASCQPPMCNPYHANFGAGIEHDYGGNDGVEGDIDVPIPLSKGVAYRFPLSGKIYYFFDNITVTYGQNLAPVDPFKSMFDYQNHRPAEFAIPRDLPDNPSMRQKRSTEELQETRKTDGQDYDHLLKYWASSRNYRGTVRRRRQLPPMAFTTPFEQTAGQTTASMFNFLDFVNSQPLPYMRETSGSPNLFSPPAVPDPAAASNPINMFDRLMRTTQLMDTLMRPADPVNLVVALIKSI